MSLALLPNSNSLRILIICDSVNFDLFMTVNLIIFYVFKLSEKWGSLPKNYTLKGTIINDLKIGWWVFNGMNDSLKIEYINIKDKPFKNQLILYNKESIDRNFSKYYKVEKSIYDKDFLRYKIYYFIPLLSKSNQDYKIFYGLLDGENLLLKNESFGKIKDDFIQFDIIIPSYKVCNDCILKMMLTQTVYDKSEERIIINQSFISDTIN